MRAVGERQSASGVSATGVVRTQGSSGVTRHGAHLAHKRQLHGRTRARRKRRRREQWQRGRSGRDACRHTRRRGGRSRCRHAFTHSLRMGRLDLRLRSLGLGRGGVSGSSAGTPSFRRARRLLVRAARLSCVRLIRIRLLARTRLECGPAALLSCTQFHMGVFGSEGTGRERRLGQLRRGGRRAGAGRRTARCALGAHSGRERRGCGGGSRGGEGRCGAACGGCSGGSVEGRRGLRGGWSRGGGDRHT